MEIQQRILKFITRMNWILFFLASSLGFFIFSIDFGLGILCGGLLVTLNFHLLYRTLKNSLRPPHIASVGSMLSKYYIRFVFSGVLIFFLISQHLVNPLGLFIGLSVVVASIMLATVCELGKLIFFKEAS